MTYTIESIIIDRPSTHPIIVGDATPLKLRESCPGHPTHKNHVEIDFDYPLISGKGTQYWRENLERFWISRNSENMILDEDKIDWWVVWQFTIRLKRNLPDSKIMTQFIIHEKIFDLIVKKAGLKLYSKEYTEFNSIISQDIGRNYNHDTHMHFNLRMR